MLGVKANTGIPFFAFKTVVHQRSQTLKEQHINTKSEKDSIQIEEKEEHLKSTLNYDSELET